MATTSSSRVMDNRVMANNKAVILNSNSTLKAPTTVPNSPTTIAETSHTANTKAVNMADLMPTLTAPAVLVDQADREDQTVSED
jgi:hypothetical protein